MNIEYGINNMAKVSIIIPSCNEIQEVSPGVTVLQRTVQDIYEKATGDVLELGIKESDR